MNLSKKHQSQLTPQVFHILLALFNHVRPAHRIRSQVSIDSMTRVELSSSTLYEALPRLIKQGLIEIAPDHPLVNSDSKQYRLTPLGKRALEQEVRRLKIAVQVAEGRLLAEKYKLSEPQSLRQ
jgi:DNA-binding PadR family transcriptional regulator